MKKWHIWLTVAILGTSISACNFSKNEVKASEGTNRMDVEVASENDTDTSTEAASAADETLRDDWELPQSFAGSWQLDAEKTGEQLKNHDTLSAVFGTELGAYASAMEISEDGSFRCFIGSGGGGTYGSGQCEADGEGILVSVTPFENINSGEASLQILADAGQEPQVLIMKYKEEDIYWSLDLDGERSFEKDGIRYVKVMDLKDEGYHWVSALSEGTPITDSHGHNTVDYNSQKHRFICLDDGAEIEVRRWDTLRYSAGEYLIFEYDGTMHISKSKDLYRPVLSVKGSANMLSKVPDGYMIVDAREYTITYYDMDFRVRKTVDGYRAMENNTTYQDGLMAVRDMETGLMGYMNQEGNLTIPCEYGYLSDFSNGYASVLVGGELISYTEDSGTIEMYETEGGQWGIIDTQGEFVVKPSERFANLEREDMDWYCGTRSFSPVREDGTVDFVANDEDGKVLETIQIP